MYIIQPFYNFTQIWSKLSILYLCVVGELLLLSAAALYKQNISNIPSCYKYWILNLSFSSREAQWGECCCLLLCCSCCISMNFNWLICCTYFTKIQMSKHLPLNYIQILKMNQFYTFITRFIHIILRSDYSYFTMIFH